MKNVWFILAVVFAIAGCITTAHFQERADKAELALARTEAVQATGPCGDQFSVTVNNGEFVENYVGGQRVRAVDVAAYFQEQTADGDIILFRKVGSGKEKEYIMARRKR